MNDNSMPHPPSHRPSRHCQRARCVPLPSTAAVSPRGHHHQARILRPLQSPEESTSPSLHHPRPLTRRNPFKGGAWEIHVELPDQHPYKSPSLGFQNRIFHPNIDEMSGSVCLDVINQTWPLVYDMVNIFEVLLPQLLRYSNHTDLLSRGAAHEGAEDV